MASRTRVRLILAAVVSAVVVGAPPAAANTAEGRHHHAHHDHAHHAKRQLTVMTQNLYLGSSLTPAITATTPEAFVQAVAEIYGTAVFTNFPARAEAIADTIAAEDPDLVGLQEVTRWIAQPTIAGPTPPSFDFLAILQAELAERGLDYSVAAVSENADIGPAPLAAPAYGCVAPTAPDCVVTLQDRDVILVNDDTRHLKVRRSLSGDYVAQEVLTPPVGEPVSFGRGWAAIDAKYQGRKFRFLTTHLEVEDFAATQEAQGQEFLAGPSRVRGPVIATGDFNSAADPATTSTPTTTYADLTDRFYRDAWDVNPGDPGLTCCQSGTLTNLDSRLATRIDLVLTHGAVWSKEAHVVGDTVIPGAVAPPFWASDHAGVVAKLRLR
jgi:endonuclease/exonuclease/phosphatase family metal-dependent hydrolase